MFQKKKLFHLDFGFGKNSLKRYVKCFKKKIIDFIFYRNNLSIIILYLPSTIIKTFQKENLTQEIIFLKRKKTPRWSDNISHANDSMPNKTSSQENVFVAGI